MFRGVQTPTHHTRWRSDLKEKKQKGIQTNKQTYKQTKDRHSSLPYCRQSSFHARYFSWELPPYYLFAILFLHVLLVLLGHGCGHGPIGVPVGNLRCGHNVSAQSFLYILIFMIATTGNTKIKVAGVCTRCNCLSGLTLYI